MNYLQKVQKVDESIIEVYDQGDESVEERKLAEITSQTGYNDSISDELTLIEKRIDISLPTNSNPPLQPPMAVKIPKLECKIFDGTSKDKLEFKNFVTQFSNCIDACGTLSKKSSNRIKDKQVSHTLLPIYVAICRAMPLRLSVIFR